MKPSFYLKSLYPLQDHVLSRITPLDTRFYLSGGTAISRGYLQHRFSDDLDLFVNDDPRFPLWLDRIIHSLGSVTDWRVEIHLREERFGRIVVHAASGLWLKVEFINDVPSHIGELRVHPILGRLDSPQNILANKLTALVDRDEPKDMADIWALCTRLGLSIITALEDADSKAAGLFPADVARRLLTAAVEDWNLVRWQEAPDPNRFIAELGDLGRKLLLIDPKR